MPNENKATSRKAASSKQSAQSKAKATPKSQAGAKSQAGTKAKASSKAKPSSASRRGGAGGGAGAGSQGGTGAAKRKAGAGQGAAGAKSAAKPKASAKKSSAAKGGAKSRTASRKSSARSSGMDLTGALSNYVDSMKGRLKDWGIEIDTLKAKADQTGAAARGEFQKQFEALRAMQQEASKRLQQVAEATGPAWHDFARGIERAMNDLRTAAEPGTRSKKK